MPTLPQVSGVSQAWQASSGSPVGPRAWGGKWGGGLRLGTTACGSGAEWRSGSFGGYPPKQLRVTSSPTSQDALRYSCQAPPAPSLVLPLAKAGWGDLNDSWVCKMFGARSSAGVKRARGFMPAKDLAL
ncbi:nodal-like protein [Platysternon megacephalum]|uniref:Nodal-like protein n=1 Tax=Platysternon megacephalum TaxID=55544 RepID=A0A4D9ES97_9SAUR|nr:nodal-like protein [Platysternon megacephalum]